MTRHPTLALERIDYSNSSLRVDGHAKPRVVVHTQQIRVGRSEEMDVQVSDDALGVSRHHLTIERTRTSWQVVDVGSKHGTILTGLGLPRRVMLAHAPITLLDGAELLLGRGFDDRHPPRLLPPACIRVIMSPVPKPSGPTTAGMPDRAKTGLLALVGTPAIDSDVLNVCAAIVRYKAVRTAWTELFSRGLYPHRLRSFNKQLVRIVNDVPTIAQLYEETLMDRQPGVATRHAKTGYLRFDVEIFRETLLTLYPALETAELSP
jgi:hypothetical protein